MTRKLIYITTLFGYLLFGQDTLTINISSLSDFVTIDTKNPELQIQTPNGGEEYAEGEVISLLWMGIDDSFGETPVSIYLAPELGSYFSLIESGISNNESYSVSLPFVTSAFARFRVFAVDSYGNSSTDISDGYFMIGDAHFDWEGGSGDPQEVTIELTSEYTDLLIDTKSPVLEWVSPNDGDTFPSSAMINALVSNR